MVAWIWLGSLLVFLGGLICIWPTADLAHRRATAGYAARSHGKSVPPAPPAGAAQPPLMDVLAVVGVLAAAGAAGWAIAGPLRGGRAEADDAAYQSQLEDLEAAKEAR